MQVSAPALCKRRLGDGALYQLQDGVPVMASPGWIDWLQALDDGAIVYLHYDGFDTFTLRRVSAGVDSVLFDGFVSPVGRSLDRLFSVEVDYESDHSCSPLSISTCYEGVVWSQVVVSRIEGGALHELGHHDARGADALDPVALPLPDGRVVVELAEGTFVTAD